MGVILKQELPHLSHLGVRARQACLLPEYSLLNEVYLIYMSLTSLNACYRKRLFLSHVKMKKTLLIYKNFWAHAWGEVILLRRELLFKTNIYLTNYVVNNINCSDSVMFFMFLSTASIKLVRLEASSAGVNLKSSSLVDTDKSSSIKSASGDILFRTEIPSLTAGRISYSNQVENIFACSDRVKFTLSAN